jgi:hypothetical protein
MTIADLDSLPFDYPSEPTPNGATGKPRCRRHEWGPLAGSGWLAEHVGAVVGDVCQRCGHLKSAIASRRGRSSDRLGKDQERRIQRVYGPRKRGQYGDAVDHLGATFKWQSKATRGPVPLWLADLSEHSRLPVSITNAMAHMTDVFTDHLPLVIRSYVRQGVPTRDYVFVRFRDWWNLHGPMAGNRDVRVIEGATLTATAEAFVVMAGSTFLDLHGRDEP